MGLILTKNLSAIAKPFIMRVRTDSLEDAADMTNTGYGFINISSHLYILSKFPHFIFPFRKVFASHFVKNPHGPKLGRK